MNRKPATISGKKAEQEIGRTSESNKAQKSDKNKIVNKGSAPGSTKSSEAPDLKMSSGSIP